MKTSLYHTVATIALLPALLLTGCELTENALKVDRGTGMEIQDYRDALGAREADAPGGDSAEEGTPALEDYVTEDAANLKAMPMVTVSVDETIPLKDVLYELARQANYDVELDPRISGAIIFSARNRPFDQVMERIAELGGLRYTMKDDTIRIELDTPYSQTYKIDYLPIIRSVTSDISNSVKVSGEGSTSTGSAFSLSGKTEVDFWKDLETNLEHLVLAETSRGALRTDRTPTVTVAPASEGASTPPAAPTAQGAGAGGSSAPPAAPTGAQQPVLQVGALDEPATDAAAATPATGEEAGGPSYSINKQAGLVSVFANERVQRRVSEYLEELRRRSTAQVLIEAKVLEVALKDEFATGVDWSALDLTAGKNPIINVAAPAPALSPSTTSGITIGATGAALESVVQAVSRFGTINALSSPRLTVMNNQSAALNVADNIVYFEVNVEITEGTTTNTGSTTVDSTAKSVPEGILMNVTPSIDLDTQTISMTVRPTISRVKSYKEDPGVAFAAAQGGVEVSNLVPELSVQEFDSMIKMHSGDVMVMGGLLKDRTTSEQRGVPILSEAPLLGGLFRSQGDKVEKTELVVFLKATIVDGAGQTIDKADREVYKTFARDRHPLPM